MKLVIDIKDKEYKELVNPYQFNEYLCNKLKEIVRNGIPLPQGHGRLFDERDIVDGSYEIIGNRIYELEPILEADISKKEKKYDDDEV